MVQDQKVIALIFKKLSESIHKLSDSEFNELNDGKFSINIDTKLAKNNIRKGKSDQKDSLDEDKIVSITKLLQEIENREKGLEILEEHCKTRSNLERIAKYLDLHIIKSDNIDKLKQKIIESTIGYRLRSKAIQGNHPNP